MSKPVITKSLLQFSNSMSLICVRYKPSSIRVHSLEKHLDFESYILHPSLALHIQAYMTETKLYKITLTLATHNII